MAKYALQKIRYRPTTSFRSGPGTGYEYREEDDVVAHWSMSSNIIDAPFPTPDMVEEKYKITTLRFANTSARGVMGADVPSTIIAKNSSLFNKTDLGIATDAAGTLSFTDGTSDKPFSIAFWIKPVSTAENQTILSKWDDANNLEEYIIEILSNNKIKVRLASAGNGSTNKVEYTSTGTVPDSAWSHVVVAYDANPQTGNTESIKVYINGVDTGRSAGATAAGYVSMIPTSTPLGIGRDSVGANDGVHAYLSDIILYKKALLPRSILALYNAKDGVWKRSRNYDKKGSSAQMVEGGDIDSFREGVSIRNGEDLSTSIRMKIHSSLQFVKAHSGSAVSVDVPFDDSDTPFALSVPKASSRITIAGGAIDVNTKINIISTAQSSSLEPGKIYIGITENHTTIANGTILAEGMALTNAITLGSDDPRIGMVAFMVGSSAADAANMLEIAINHVNGHNGGSRNKKISIKNNGAGRLDLTQEQQGTNGNTTITVVGDTSNRITVLNGGFTGGTNNVSSKFTGILNSSRGKSGYTSLLLHEVEKRDFGTLNRYQDGTPFNDNVFDSPQKILEDVRTISGNSQDRHLRVYIGETPNELYNPTDVYDKEARVDIFDRNISFRETIPDLRDAEKDFTKRSRRLTRSGSWTLPLRNRGFTGECNCIHLADARYNDPRESSIPFYEFYNEGDFSLPSHTQTSASYDLNSSWYLSYTHENMHRHVNLSSNLIAYWRLASINPTGVMLDESSYPHLHIPQIKDGTNYATIDPGDTPSARIQAGSTLFGAGSGGDPDTAFRLDDANDILLPATSTSHRAMSISVWVKQTTNEGNGNYIISKENVTGDVRSFRLYTYQSRIHFMISGDGTSDTDVISRYIDYPGSFANNWHHICITYDGSGTRAGINIYANGVIQAMTNTNNGTLSAIPPKSAYPVTIGGGYQGASGHLIQYGWMGNLADLAIFNKSLSASDVKNIYDVVDTKIFTVATPAYQLEGSSFRHPGRGKIETVLSQSSGPRLTEVKPKDNEPYGVYAQSTVNTFYGIPGSDKLQGRTFTARYRVLSADRPFYDTSKEDLVPTLINTSNDTDFITEIKTLYMTGTSVHESGHTGYNLSTTGFQGDLGLHKRDSLVFIGLKRGQ